MSVTEAPDDLGASTVKEICARYQISRARVYAEVKVGRLRVMKAGKKSLISRQAERDWITACEAEPLRSSPNPAARKQKKARR